MKMILENLSTIGSGIALVGSLIGGAYFIEDRYVDEDSMQTEFVAVNDRLETVEYEIKSKIFKDQLWQLNERIFLLEDRLEQHPERKNVIVIDIKRLQQEKEQVQQKIDKLSPQNARKTPSV